MSFYIFWGEILLLQMLISTPPPLFIFFLQTAAAEPDAHSPVWFKLNKNFGAVYQCGVKVQGAVGGTQVADHVTPLYAQNTLMTNQQFWESWWRWTVGWRLKSLELLKMWLYKNIVTNMARFVSVSDWGRLFFELVTAHIIQRASTPALLLHRHWGVGKLSST